MTIAGKVIILTGASAGIGRATAVTLTRRGAHVIATARRADRLEGLAADCANHPGRLIPAAGDVRQTGLGKQLLETALDHFQNVDILINNAGIGHKSGLDNIPPADINQIWATNLNGPLLLTQALLPHMRHRGVGHIINISSIVSVRPLPNSAVYCASKAALNALSRSLRIELSGSGIAVSLVYPGGTHSEFAAARLGDSSPAAFSRWRVPADRVAQTILKTIRNRRPYAAVTLFDWAFMHGNRLFPRVTDQLVALFRRQLAGDDVDHSN